MAIGKQQQSPTKSFIDRISGAVFDLVLVCLVNIFVLIDF